VGEVGRAAEAAGFDSVWVAETRITRDAVTTMTALLLATRRLRVGSAAINAYTRGAALVAITWAAMEEAAPGRVVLGIGPGSYLPLVQQGYSFDRPVSRLEETVKAIRAVWTQRPPITFQGRFVQLNGLQPEVVPGSPPPIYLCVTGPRALQLAGKVADGVVLNGFMPPAYVERARSLLDSAAGGRFVGEIAGALVVSLGASVAEAAARVRPILATYLVHFPHLARETGLDPDFLSTLRATAQAGGLEATFAMLPDRLVAEYALCGTAPDCRDRLEDYRRAGLQLPIFFPDPGGLPRVIAELADA
jgi:5,10-methylenetetrahydromethanopterin reductase